MRYKGMSRSHLFLIELIIVVLFFAFASVITVQVFSKSFQLDEKTSMLNGALSAVQTAAETDKTIAFQMINADEKSAYYDDSWNITERSSAVFTIRTTVELKDLDAGVMAVYHYTAASVADNRVIYELEARKYYSGVSSVSGS